VGTAGRENSLNENEAKGGILAENFLGHFGSRKTYKEGQNFPAEGKLSITKTKEDDLILEEDEQTRRRNPQRNVWPLQQRAGRIVATSADRRRSTLGTKQFSIEKSLEKVGP